MERKWNGKRRGFTALTAFYLATLFSVYLLYPGFGGYQTITAQKWSAYLLITGLYVAVMLLLRLELAVVGAEKLPSPGKIWRSMGLPHKLILLYLCVTALSAVCSDYRSTAIWGGGRREGLVAIALYCVSFLLISAFCEPKRWMLWLFAGALSLNCCLCLLQFAGFNPLGLYPPGMNYYDGNLRYAGEFLGTVGNVDILSAILSLSIPALWAAILHGTAKRERILLLVPLALCLVVLGKSFVAGGILGVAGAVALSAPVMVKGKRRRKGALLAVVGVVVLTAAAVYCFGGAMGGFLYEASELMHGRWNDDFGSGRLYIWRNVVELIPQRPLLGGGPDTLGCFTDAVFSRFDETLGIVLHSEIDAAHNEYLNIMVNQGVIAFFLYMAALVASAVRWVRGSEGNSLVILSGCAVLGYCIQAFFGLSSPISTPYFWVALALLNPMGRTVEPSAERQCESSPIHPA